eukprot:710644_1
MASILEEEKQPPFISHMTHDEVSKLTKHEKIDHRDSVGRFVFATISEKQGTNLKIHYDGWSRKWDVWSNYSIELYRFAKHKSISLRPAHRFTDIKPDHFVDINPKHVVGWTAGIVRRKDRKSGQVQVSYWDGKKDTRSLMWVHLDDETMITEIGTKSPDISVHFEGYKRMVIKKKDTVKIYALTEDEVIKNPYSIGDMVNVEDQTDQEFKTDILSTVAATVNNFVLATMNG